MVPTLFWSDGGGDGGGSAGEAGIDDFRSGHYEGGAGAGGRAK